ncbi:MAG: Arm DNA-binding domain-containing protein [Burkholderiaceae bacterium]
MALTDTALKALKPREKVFTVADNRGLYVEVFPTGGVVWRYRYRLNGKLEKLTLGKYPALTLKNARFKRDEAAQAAAMGTSPAEQKRLAKVAAADATTVAEFGERFFREIVHEHDRQGAPAVAAAADDTRRWRSSAVVDEVLDACGWQDRGRRNGLFTAAYDGRW